MELEEQVLRWVQSRCAIYNLCITIANERLVQMQETSRQVAKFVDVLCYHFDAKARDHLKELQHAPQH